MENWTLDKWLVHLDECAEGALYFEISGHDAGLLRDRINHLKDKLEGENKRLIDALQSAFAVMAVQGNLGKKLSEAREIVHDALVEAHK